MNTTRRVFIRRVGEAGVGVLGIPLCTWAIDRVPSETIPGPAGMYDPNLGRYGAHAPLFIQESPNNEASIVVFPDGEIRIFSTPERHGQQTIMIRSDDHGHSWTAPEMVLEDKQIWQYPRECVLEEGGLLHMLIFRRPALDVLYTQSRDRGQSWATLRQITKGRIGAIRGFVQLRSGRLLYAYHRRESKSSPQTGSCYISSVYSDDHGQTWQESGARLLAPVFPDANANNYGAVEPTILELTDRRLWMLARTQTGCQYEYFSNDGGHAWSDGRPSIFYSTNSPARLFRMADGRVLMIWCNNVQPKREIFGRIYVNREVLHMAISEDDGNTWRGFREVYRLPSRDTNAPGGDNGTSYPNVDMTHEGKIIVVTGQGHGPGNRAILLLDPAFLYQMEQADDFSHGLERWCTYTFVSQGLKPTRRRGPELMVHPDDPKLKVLHLRKEDEHIGDGASWNFPMGRRGQLQLEVQLGMDTQQVGFSLGDAYHHPTSPEVRERAMFTATLGGQGDPDVPREEWITLELQWDLEGSACWLLAGDRRLKKLPLQNPTRTGISYLVIQSLAKNMDEQGLLTNWANVQITEPFSEQAFSPADAGTMQHLSQ